MIKIIIFILLILLLIFFITISEPVHIYLNFKNKGIELSGSIKIKYLILKLELLFDKKLNLNLFLSLKSFEKKIFTKLFDLPKKEDNETNIEKTNEVTQDDLDQIENENKEVDDEKAENKENINYKEILNILNKIKDDLIKILIYMLKSIKYQESYLLLNFGIKNNYYTIKICSIIWSLVTPFNALEKFEFNLTPIMDKLCLDIDTKMNINIELINYLSIIIIILKNNEIRKLIFENVKDLF